MIRSVPRAPKPAPPPNPRRERILDAAQEMFRARGLRGVTMEALAAEATVAKATLYSYFANRDAVFVATAERLAGRLEQGVSAALQRPGRPAARVVAALTWKHRTVHDLTQGSGHARELLGAKDRLARARFERADRDMIAALADTLAEDRALAPAAGALARALFFGTQGLAENPSRDARLEVEIETFVLSLLRGARGRIAPGGAWSTGKRGDGR